MKWLQNFEVPRSEALPIGSFGGRGYFRDVNTNQFSESSFIKVMPDALEGSSFETTDARFRPDKTKMNPDED